MGNKKNQFLFRLFPGKRVMTKLLKKSRKTYFGAIGKIEFSWEKKGSASFYVF